MKRFVSILGLLAWIDQLHDTYHDSSRIEDCPGCLLNWIQLIKERDST